MFAYLDWSRNLWRVRAESDSGWLEGEWKSHGLHLHPSRMRVSSDLQSYRSPFSSYLQTESIEFLSFSFHIYFLLGFPPALSETFRLLDTVLLSFLVLFKEFRHIWRRRRKVEKSGEKCMSIPLGWAHISSLEAGYNYGALQDCSSEKNGEMRKEFLCGCPIILSVLHASISFSLWVKMSRGLFPFLALLLLLLLLLQLFLFTYCHYDYYYNAQSSSGYFIHRILLSTFYFHSEKTTTTHFSREFKRKTFPLWIPPKRFFSLFHYVIGHKIR